MDEIQLLNRLQLCSASQLAELAFRIGVPATHLSSSVPPTTVCLQIIGYLTQQQRLDELEDYLTNQPRSAAVAVRLPYDLPDEAQLHAFIGRKAELMAMAAVLLPDDDDDDAPPRGPGGRRPAEPETRRVFVLTGPSGIGKSMLAQKLAADARDADRFDAAVYLSAAQDAEAIARELAIALGATDAEQVRGRMLWRLLEDRCRGNRILVMANDARDERSLRELLDKLPREVAVIVTTQRRNLHSLVTDPARQHRDLGVLGLADSLAVLARELGDDAIRTSEDARRICAAVGYLPQALHVVAKNCGRDGLWTLPQFVALFCANEDRKQLFDHGLSLESEPQSLKDVLDTILERLKLGAPGIDELYSSLAACDPTGFSVATAAAAAGCDPLTAAPLLAQLHRHALVDRIPRSDHHYALHTLFAAHAACRARAAGTDERARASHTRFWMGRLREADVSALWLPPDLRTERGDVALAASRHAAAGELDAELIEKLNDFFDRAQMPARAVQTMTEAIQWADSTDDPAAGALARIRLAKFRGRSSPAAALAELEPVGALIAALPDGPQRRSLEIKRLVRTGALEKHIDRAQAVETLTRAVALARDSQDPKAIRHALDALARVHRDLGDLDAALEAVGESLRSGSDDVPAAARFLGCLFIADCLVERGDLPAARARYDECRRLGAGPGALVHLASHLLTFAQALRDRAQARRDRSLLGVALEVIKLQNELADELDNKWLYVRGLIVLGDTYIKARDVAGALAAYRAVADEKRAPLLRETRPITGALRQLARDLCQQGRKVDELPVLELAGTIAEAGRDHDTQATICNRLGQTYVKARQYELAARKFQDQIALGKRHGLPNQQAYGHVALARLHRQAEAFDQQLEHYQAALQALNATRGQAAIDGRLAVVAELAIGAVWAGKLEDAVDAVVEVARLRPLARRVRSSAWNAHHNVASMLVSRRELPAIVALLRARFARDATPEVAAALAPLAIQLAEAGFQRQAPGPDAAEPAWWAPVLLALELLMASSPADQQRGFRLLSQLAQPVLKNGATDPARGSLGDIAGIATGKRSIAYPVASGFVHAVLALAAAKTRWDEHSLAELQTAAAWARDCPLAVVRSYVCKGLADSLKAHGRTDDAEQLYRASLDACALMSDLAHQPKALMSLYSLLRKPPGRESEALDCLVRLADGPVRYLEDSHPAEQSLRDLARRFGDMHDPTAALRAARALVAVATERGSLEAEAYGWNHQGRALRELGDLPAALDAFEHQVRIGIENESADQAQHGFTRIEETLRRAAAARLREGSWHRLIGLLEGSDTPLATALRARAWGHLGTHYLDTGRLHDACGALVGAVSARGLPDGLPDVLRLITMAIPTWTLAEQVAPRLLEIVRTGDRSPQLVAGYLLHAVAEILRRHGRTAAAGHIATELAQRGVATGNGSLSSIGFMIDAGLARDDGNARAAWSKLAQVQTLNASWPLATKLRGLLRDISADLARSGLTTDSQTAREMLAYVGWPPPRPPTVAAPPVRRRPYVDKARIGERDPN
jgi:tetratricopeptide (TPR) repeat protein